MSFWGRLLKILQSQLAKKLRDYSLGLRDSCWPSLGRLLLLRLIGNLFSVTDKKHDIVQSAVLLQCQCLSQCPVSSIKDLSSGLLVCGTLLDYTTETKRYIPELTLFAASVLAVYQPTRKPSSDETSENKAVMLKTFNYKVLGSLANLVPETYGFETRPLLSWSVFSDSLKDIDLAGVDVSTAIATSALQLIKTLHERFNNFSAYPEMMSIVIPTLTSKILRAVDGDVGSIQNHCSQIVSSRQPLQWRKTSVQSIEMKTPRFELDYTFKKDLDPDAERVKLKQLNRQLKREKKAAMRELRRDSNFLDQQKYVETARESAARQNERHKNFSWMEEQQATINQQVKKGKSLLKGGGSGVGKKRKIK